MSKRWRWIDGFIWFITVALAFGLGVAVITTPPEVERAPLTAKVTACATARASVPRIQRALRDEPDTGIALAHQLGLWMRYCDGARGVALARAIEEAILAGIPRRREDSAAVDVDRIADALATFARAEAPPP